MKKIIFIILLNIFGNITFSQCGDSSFCNGNTGLYSNDDATNIAYDNMGSSFHSTYIKEPNGLWRVWGEQMTNNGIAHALAPINFNSTNYPALTGTIYKMGLGSNSITDVQLVVLTSTGLFILGEEGNVLNPLITTSNTFQKVTINGKTDGLPIGITPLDVKMMFVTTGTIMITTCIGEVYVISTNNNMRGNGSSVGLSTQWYKVLENINSPLTDVIVARGSASTGFALKSDGTIWTWGNSFLGNNTAFSTRYYATQMTLPAGINGIKMIQCTGTGNNTPNPSYYVQGTNKKIYALGINDDGELGDNTSIDRTSWVNCKNPDGTIIDNAAWISANEHDLTYAAIAVIKTGGLIYTAGINSGYMVGRTVNNGINYLNLPTGISATDIITHAETGGHTCALIKLGSPRYGYVGHRINGSVGDGNNITGFLQSYNFIIPPIVAICGTVCATPTITTNSPICIGQNAVFTISGTAGDIVSYTINNGASQNITIGVNGSVSVTISNVTINQTITLTYILGATASCSNLLSVSATVATSGTIVPTFNQIAPICIGAVLNPLPTTSINGILGTWSPAVNNLQTTTYTFIPTNNSCASNATMTISVNNTLTTPTFTQIAPICSGQVLSPLPATSINGVSGNWSPAINNLQTTNYVFVPNTASCTNTTANMTIVVNAKQTANFSLIAPICVGENLNNLPTTSLNGIAGIWSPAINNLQTTTYNFTPSNSFCADNASMIIVVNPKTIPTFTQVTPICAGSVLSNLPTTSLNGFSGTWSPTIDNLQTKTYTFTPTNTFCANVSTMTIVVNPKITPIFMQVNPICSGGLLASLPTSSNNGITGNWSPAINNLQTTNYVFVPNTASCTNTTANMTISVTPKVTPTFAATNAICEGNLLPNLPTISINGISGSWSPAINNLQTTTYTFYPNANECAIITTQKIEVFSAFDFEFDSYCEKGDFFLQILPLANSFNLNTSNFSWSSNTIVVNNTNKFNVSEYLRTLSNFDLPLTFDVKIIDNNNCTKSKSIDVLSVYCNIQKGISPNDDNKNDFFDLKLLKPKHLTIFNRYGTKVYSKHNYLNEWNGQTDDGTILPDGTYFYYIEFENDGQKTGWVYINRELR